MISNSIPADSKLAKPRQDGLQTFAAGLKLPPSAADRRAARDAERAEGEKAGRIGAFAFAQRLGLRLSEFNEGVRTGIFPGPDAKGSATLDKYWNAATVAAAVAKRGK